MENKKIAVGAVAGAPSAAATETVPATGAVGAAGAPSAAATETAAAAPETAWWKNGVQFQCQGSGKCCTSHGEFGYVFLSPEDRARFAKYMNIRVTEFTKKYCEKTGGVWHLIEKKGQPDCMFLEGKRCGVYEARPSQCRTWPFWPEVMNAKSWQKDVVEFCPGVGKGRVIPAAEIESILAEQMHSEKHLGK